MLIVNADDLGRNITATDNILCCHARRRVSSASAMMFMADSERAAELAQRAGLDTGLHVNYSELFTGAAPPSLLDDQRSTIRFLKSARPALILYNPFLTRQFRDLFAAQYAEYIRLYGRAPAHIDGHQHMHLASNVLLQRLVPNGALVRRNFSFASGEKSGLNRWYRAKVDRLLASRHTISDYFFAIQHLLATDRLDHAIALARDSSVEIMVHPEDEDDLQFLLSDRFSRALGDAPLSPYTALAKR